MPHCFFHRSWIWIWEPNCYHLAEKSLHAFMVMFMLESDFRQVCFAVRSGCHAESCPGTKRNRSMGSWGLGVWGEAERMFTSLSSTFSWWTEEMVELLLLRSASQRCMAKEQESAVQHWNFWLDIRGEKIPGEVEKHWSRFFREMVSFYPSVRSEPDKALGSWLSGIHAEGKQDSMTSRGASQPTLYCGSKCSVWVC